jgi:hypothetical protein
MKDSPPVLFQQHSQGNPYNRKKYEIKRTSNQQAQRPFY